ncbi:MAG TPA: response regulator [Candidatus Nitrosopolaris sp.]|nr:response regulator [Candidatus Nitrosopolaris sp.]
MRTTKIDPSLSATNNRTQRILLVDDDADISNLFRLSLERDGFVVDTFNDPLLALFNYKAGAYDLLLLDIKMPNMNGFELFQKIKSLDDKVKVCFVTAFEESNIEFRRLFPNMEEGDCFITKPIELRALAEKVKSQLAA